MSAAYADLGGGLGIPSAVVPRLARPAVQRVPALHQCRFESSGWCGCGRRDDGTIAEGSPAWRSQAVAA